MDERCESFACVFETDGKCVNGKPCETCQDCAICYCCRFRDDCEREGNK